MHVFIIVIFFSLKGQWMDYMRRLGNSYTASGRRDPEGPVAPSYSLGRQYAFFIRARFTSFHTRSSIFFLCFCYFIFAVPMRECMVI